LLKIKRPSQNHPLDLPPVSATFKAIVKTAPQKSAFDDLMRKVSLIKPTKPKKNAKRKK
jgi:hypothetical protein